jgi:hypothetical protein
VKLPMFDVLNTPAKVKELHKNISSGNPRRLAPASCFLPPLPLMTLRRFPALEIRFAQSTTIPPAATTASVKMVRIASAIPIFAMRRLMARKFVDLASCFAPASHVDFYFARHACELGCCCSLCLRWSGAEQGALRSRAHMWTIADVPSTPNR